MLRKNGYKQGIFNPTHPEKYKGSSPIIYRSSLECHYMRWLDACRDIITWASESVVIPYMKPTDGKLHRYFIDFNFVLKSKDGLEHKYLIEIKPKRQCLPPLVSARKSKKTMFTEGITYAVNQAKWDAAKQWATKNNYKFAVLNEDYIKGLKY